MEKYLIYDFKDDYGREPIIRKAQNGTLICIFLTGGTWEPENENVVKIMKSYDKGKTWTEPTILFSHIATNVIELFIASSKYSVPSSDVGQFISNVESKFSNSNSNNILFRF